MSGIKYVVDTNCFIYLLDENPILLPFIDSTWAFSYITEIELLCKEKITTPEETLIRHMLSMCYKVEHSQQLTEFVIELKRQYNIKVPDAIIAATARMLNLPLLTADMAFTKVKSIDCIIVEVA